jgi:antitoxin (DNA-binding transcriptional repressor) of toxin-antitoxin stability system
VSGTEHARVDRDNLWRHRQVWPTNVVARHNVYAMHTVGIREISNRLSRYIRRLKPGQSIAITHRGRVVAELRAATSMDADTNPSAYARLVSSGVVRLAREHGDPLGNLRTQRGIAAPTGTVAVLIREDRAG